MAEKIWVAELLMSLIFEHKLYITDEGSYSKNVSWPEINYIFNHLVDTSAGELLVLEGIILAVVKVSSYVLSICHSTHFTEFNKSVLTLILVSYPMCISYFIFVK